MQFNQFFNYCIHNNDEIRESPKVKVKAKETN